MKTDLKTAEIPGVKRNILLSEHSWFRIGGPADFFISVENTSLAREALLAAAEDGLPVFILGGGSNVLFDSRGYRGLVIKTEFKDFSIDGVQASVGAGCSLSYVIRQCAEKRLGGWEGLFGIPGTVGGAVRGNAGAYGTEIGNFVEKVFYLDDRGKEMVMEQDKSMFRYRHSIFKEKQALLFRIEFELHESNPDILQSRMKEIEDERAKKHPLNNTAGCFFKNPKEYGVSAARLIEKAGLKGASEGNAMVSEKHANFIVNTGGASSSDVLSLAERIKQRIREANGIVLEEEVEIVPEKSSV